MYKSAHGYSRNGFLVCYNKNSVVISCTLNYAYFSIVTETGACLERGKIEISQMNRIWRECASAMKTDIKEKTGCILWYWLEAPVKVTHIPAPIVVLHVFWLPCSLLFLLSWRLLLSITCNSSMSLLPFSYLQEICDLIRMLFDADSFVANPSNMDLYGFTKPQ